MKLNLIFNKFNSRSVLRRSTSKIFAFEIFPLYGSHFICWVCACARAARAWRVCIHGCACSYVRACVCVRSCVRQGRLTAPIIQWAYVAKCSIELMTCKACLYKGFACPQEILRNYCFKRINSVLIVHIFSTCTVLIINIPQLATYCTSWTAVARLIVS